MLGFRAESLAFPASELVREVCHDDLQGSQHFLKAGSFLVDYGRSGVGHDFDDAGEA